MSSPSERDLSEGERIKDLTHILLDLEQDRMSLSLFGRQTDQVRSKFAATCLLFEETNRKVIRDEHFLPLWIGSRHFEDRFSLSDRSHHRQIRRFGFSTMVGKGFFRSVHRNTHTSLASVGVPHFRMH